MQSLQICTIKFKIMMQPAICLLPVVPLRKEPSHRSEMVSQLLFGEYVELGEEKDGFVRVTCLYDGYPGWVQAGQLTVTPNVWPTSLYVRPATANVFINGVRKVISTASPVYQPGQSLHVGTNKIEYSLQPEEVWNMAAGNDVATDLEAVYGPYLYTPYLWGGKSVFGIDCSGFVQQVFKFFGVKLLRDAYLQAEQGTPVASLEEARPADLVFFQNDNGRVTHVGILLENSRIVHAAARVRIDRLNAAGIVQRETGEQTHRFHSIRRYF